MTAYAGLKKARAENLVDPHWRTVILITGNGLKDVASVMKVTGEPRLIPPDPAVLEELYGRGSDAEKLRP